MDLAAARVGIVGTQFALLNKAARQYGRKKNLAGYLTPELLFAAYVPENHPDVVSGAVSADAARREFTDVFPVEYEGLVTKKDFEDYYAIIGAPIHDDAEFKRVVAEPWAVEHLKIRVATPPEERQKRRAAAAVKAAEEKAVADAEEAARPKTPPEPAYQRLHAMATDEASRYCQRPPSPRQGAEYGHGATNFAHADNRLHSVLSYQGDLRTAEHGSSANPFRGSLRLSPSHGRLPPATGVASVHSMTTSPSLRASSSSSRRFLADGGRAGGPSPAESGVDFSHSTTLLGGRAQSVSSLRDARDGPAPYVCRELSRRLRMYSGRGRVFHGWKAAFLEISNADGSGAISREMFSNIIKDELGWTQCTGLQMDAVWDAGHFYYGGARYSDEDELQKTWKREEQRYLKGAKPTYLLWRRLTSFIEDTTASNDVGRPPDMQGLLAMRRVDALYSRLRRSNGDVPELTWSATFASEEWHPKVSKEPGTAAYASASDRFGGKAAPAEPNFYPRAGFTGQGRGLGRRHHHALKLDPKDLKTWSPEGDGGEPYFSNCREEKSLLQARIRLVAMLADGGASELLALAVAPALAVYKPSVEFDVLGHTLQRDLLESLVPLCEALQLDEAVFVKHRLRDPDIPTQRPRDRKRFQTDRARRVHEKLHFVRADVLG